MQNTQAIETIFSQSKPGNRAVVFPRCDVPERPLAELIPAGQLAGNPPPLPESAEIDIVRHFSNLALRNMSVDTHFYPLGSCTMKYNPKRNERFASSPKLLALHPGQPAKTMQGQLRILHELQEMIAEISGLPGVSLQPAAGAHGELTALLVAEKYLTRKYGPKKKTTVLIPDGAHGTNPASAAFAGFKTVEIKSTPEGLVDLDDLRARLGDDTAVFMITNPNTLGLFEPNIKAICDAVHAVGGLVYNDGANMNAICGIVRPGDFGADMMHYNVHKTFSTPHGAGGPGAGPIAVTEALAPFLPGPIVVKTVVSESDATENDATENGVDKNESNENGGMRTVYRLDGDRPESIGRVRSFFGSVAMLNRTYFYLRTLGGDGLRRMTEHAVLNANYLLSSVRDFLDVPMGGGRCMHEFVASAAALKTAKGITAMDVAKRLLDYGFHAPTVYFPLIVKEALMIEPTETENRATLDRFAEVLRSIVAEEPAFLHDAPHSTPVSRPDEVAAAQKPRLVEP
ncbi:MAG TPA: aminomethyl-transferring glycine dehydrogenase subunit GcvPB [Planctomycetaceae bacterium]|nr:aminomethyl-transferring glycine dehydrogenase subunit GcvPB [Planctomycetaceae bacterium]